MEIPNQKQVVFKLVLCFEDVLAVVNCIRSLFETLLRKAYKWKLEGAKLKSICSVWP